MPRPIRRFAELVAVGASTRHVHPRRDRRSPAPHGEKLLPTPTAAPGRREPAREDASQDATTLLDLTTLAGAKESYVVPLDHMACHMASAPRR